MNTQVTGLSVEVRPSTAADQSRCEELTRDAFWNVYAPGATEHFIWHVAHQGHSDLVPELSLVAVAQEDHAAGGDGDAHPGAVEAESAPETGGGGRIVGCVMCTRGRVGGPPAAETSDDEDSAADGRGGDDQGVLVLGPIAVDPARHGRGIGTRLLAETIQRAARAGFAGIFLYGNPAFYTDRGFAPAARWGITTPTGETPPVFLGVELADGALADLAGPLHESGLYSTDAEEVDAFDARFPAREKQVLPGQL